MDDVLIRFALQVRENFQNTRLESWNNLRNYIRKINEGIAYSEVEEKKKKKTFDKKYADDKLRDVWNKLLEEKKVSQMEHVFLVDLIDSMEFIDKPIDEKVEKLLKTFIKVQPVYINFLNKIRGIGPIFSAKLISYLGDCSKFENVSKLWAYTGNHVIDGKAPKRRRGQDANWNHNLRMLTWQISDQFVRQNKGYYRKKYNEEKEIQLNQEYKEGVLFKKYGKVYKEGDTKLSRGHAHNRAMRKIRKHFLSHYWECAREVNGLPNKKTYVEGVLKHEHIINWKEAIKQENCLMINSKNSHV